MAALTLFDLLAHTMETTDFSADWGPVIRGKVRDAYEPSPDVRILITTDRVSAFDRVLGTLPGKGQILNQMAAYWFHKTADVAPNHVLSVPHPNVTLARNCRPLPVEWVVRAYLTGVTSTSIWTHYEKGSRLFAGHVLPDGLKKNAALPQAILTPSTKAMDPNASVHDETVSKDDVLARGLVSAEMFERAEAMVLKLFQRGQTLAAARGLILADTKYELGIDTEGELRVIDEIHTPDSSRYWFKGSYETNVPKGLEPESFDKEYLRRYLASIGFKGEGSLPNIPDEIRLGASERYLEAYQTITGTNLVLEHSDPGALKDSVVKALRHLA